MNIFIKKSLIFPEIYWMCVQLVLSGARCFLLTYFKANDFFRICCVRFYAFSGLKEFSFVCCFTWKLRLDWKMVLKLKMFSTKDVQRVVIVQKKVNIKENRSNFASLPNFSTKIWYFKMQFVMKISFKAIHCLRRLPTICS